MLHLTTQNDEQTARHFLQQELVDRAWAYRQAVPESLEHIAVCFGYFSAPNEFLNSNPAVNYKKYLDMQVNVVANDPAFWATRGLMSYLASYADEESIRWLHHLFRHYGIQVNTAPGCTDPHDLTHMANADFADGTAGWTIEPGGRMGQKLIFNFAHVQPYLPRGKEIGGLARSESIALRKVQELNHIGQGYSSRNGRRRCRRSSQRFT